VSVRSLPSCDSQTPCTQYFADSTYKLSCLRTASSMSSISGIRRSMKRLPACWVKPVCRGRCTSERSSQAAVGSPRDLAGLPQGLDSTCCRVLGNAISLAEWIVRGIEAFGERHWEIERSDVEPGKRRTATSVVNSAVKPFTRGCELAKLLPKRYQTRLAQ
jgi:hypothetical protein